jgi:signal peptidase I
MKNMAEHLGLLMLIALMVACVATFLAPHFGWRVDVVYSGSMQPELKVGSIVVTRPVRPDEIKPDDIITFYSPLDQKLTSHRVIAIEPGLQVSILTKGDANGHPDPFIVPAENVVGKVCLHIPYLGYFARFVKTPVGLLITLCLPALAIIILELRNIWRTLAEAEIERRYRIEK